ncbi:MAG: hypothetical protein B6I23_02815 [Rickettsiaceae bacterium 4572_127]|nr:MAG: hypothetical protein B6I23_02815 [Rickettsiaceae bacterium 4572_127]
MSNLINPILTDILGVFGIPINTLQTVWNNIQEKRKKIALDILFKEIRDGSFSNVDKDEIVSIIARYLRDATEGVAKNNLKLMAQLINGMAIKEQLKAPSFLKYADILSTLTESEIKILVKMKNNESVEEFEDIQQALLRTGLVMLKIEYDGTTTCGGFENTGTDNFYSLTKLMYEIFYYTRFFDKKTSIKNEIGE